MPENVRRVTSMATPPCRSFVSGYLIATWERAQAKGSLLQLRPFRGFVTMGDRSGEKRRAVMEKSASRRRFLQDMTALGAASGVSAILGAASASAQPSLT